MELAYTLQPEPTPEERYRIIDPLIAYNEAQAGPRNSKEFAFFVRSETTELVGGLLGSTHFNHFFVSAIFIDQEFRREGIGRELIRRAAALALERGCDTIYLDTFDFQAPGFYEKLGFKVFGALNDYPTGHWRLYLVKRLGAGGEAQGRTTKRNFTFQPEPTPEERKRIIAPLVAYNEAQVGPENWREFALFVRSEIGEPVAGLLGFKHWNHFFVAALYVEQLFRKEGIGRELMKRAEALALEQGCDVVYLDTFDYQAPGFYEKLGFKVFGRLEDYPPGHRRFYLVKRLRSVPNG
jgi:GNAT superfamily N-acetyltransferase